MPPGDRQSVLSTAVAPEDPRVYLAAERTFLAWIRTGLSLMGFGFVVARFGLFLREMEFSQHPLTLHSARFTLWVGTALILIGVMREPVLRDAACPFRAQRETRHPHGGPARHHGGGDCADPGGDRRRHDDLPGIRAMTRRGLLSSLLLGPLRAAGPGPNASYW